MPGAANDTPARPAVSAIFSVPDRLLHVVPFKLGFLFIAFLLTPELSTEQYVRGRVLVGFAASSQSWINDAVVRCKSSFKNYGGSAALSTPD